MDKQLIERIALESEQAAGKYSHSKVELTVNTCIEHQKRIDAERGKEAAAWNYELENDAFQRLIALGVDSDTPLFLSPTIPAGMAQDAKRFAFLQDLEPEKAQAFFWNYTSRRQRAKAIDEAMIAAAEGERK